jgi:hypothetical protein
LPATKNLCLRMFVLVRMCVSSNVRAFVAAFACLALLTRPWSAGFANVSCCMTTLAAVQFPRYARVNTLRVSVAAAKGALSAEYSVEEDAHVPCLLVLPTGTDLHAHALVTSGSLILQDKSSCFPAAALFADGWHAGSTADYIDACAAPGNKTRYCPRVFGSVAC